jgi:Tfp pilus assembly protein PilF
MAPEAEYMGKARAAALKALQIDDGLAEAHASLALILENTDYDWETAEREFRRAIQLNPDYATAHQWYAEHLAWRGRFEQAFAESEEARLLDPLSVIIAADHCKILYFARQYDRAISQCHAVLQMDPQATGAQFFIFGSLIEKRKFEEAEQQIAPGQTPAVSAWLLPRKAYLYGRWGRIGEAQQFIAEVERHPKDYVYADTSALLMAYSGGGTTDQVLDVLQRAYAEHSAVLGSLKVDPMYDRLRGDTRFQQLLHRVGLDQ